MDAMNKFVAALLLLLSLTALAVAPVIAQEKSAKKAFDHFDTGFELRGQHRDLQCESCHARGNFKGTPRECQLCHVPNGLLSTSFAPPDHIPTAASCDSCHVTSNWTQVNVDHAGSLVTARAATTAPARPGTIRNISPQAPAANSVM